MRRGCGGGGGRGSLWRLQTSERLARLGSACAGAAGSPRCGPHLRVQLRAAAARLEGEARALASPAPPRHHLADGVEQALKELAHIVNRCVAKRDNSLQLLCSQFCARLARAAVAPLRR